MGPKAEAAARFAAKTGRRAAIGSLEDIAGIVADTACTNVVRSPMAQTKATEPASPDKRLSIQQAAFIGVGGMVGAGIFALLGAAGTVAGAAVWLSFLLAGAIAFLQGYSFAKLGARYPLRPAACSNTWPRGSATAISPGSPRG